MRNSLEWVPRNSSELLSTFSPDFPVKDSWEFPRIFRKIVTWDKQENLKIGYFYDIYIFLYKADKRKSNGQFFIIML